jgi:hypothetical protein
MYPARPRHCSFTDLAGPLADESGQPGLFTHVSRRIAQLPLVLPRCGVSNRSRAIRGVRTSFSPAPTARTEEESTAAYERSSGPASRNLPSSSSCILRHTPTFCQSRNRREQVAPEPKPKRVDRSFHRQACPQHEQDAIQCARSDTRGGQDAPCAEAWAAAVTVRSVSTARHQ